MTPLVANLTDDNGDGTIDLCDVPDIVVTVKTANGMFGDPSFHDGKIYVLAGDTGKLEYQFPAASFIVPLFNEIGEVELIPFASLSPAWTV